MAIKLHNNESYHVVVRNGRGDSLQINSRAKVWADDSFEWQLPAGVKIVDRKPAKTKK